MRCEKGKWNGLDSAFTRNVMAGVEHEGALWVAPEQKPIHRFFEGKWQAVETNYKGTVYALHAGVTGLWLGGKADLNGSPANLLRWDGRQWVHPNGEAEGYFGGPDGRVYTLLDSDRGLLVGGNFKNAGHKTISYLAEWDGSNWQEVAPDLDGFVFDMTYYRGDLIIAGKFTSVAGVPAKGVAIRREGVWEAPTGGVDGFATSLAVHDGHLFVGGRFTMAGKVSAQNLARWDGQNWTAIGSGVQGDIIDIAVDGDELVVVGSFIKAGGKISPYMAGVSLSKDSKKVK